MSDIVTPIMRLSEYSETQQNDHLSELLAEEKDIQRVLQRMQLISHQIMKKAKEARMNKKSNISLEDIKEDMRQFLENDWPVILRHCGGIYDEENRPFYFLFSKDKDGFKQSGDFSKVSMNEGENIIDQMRTFCENESHILSHISRKFQSCTNLQLHTYEAMTEFFKMARRFLNLMSQNQRVGH